MIKVLSQFAVVGEALSIVPVSIGLGDGELIEGKFRIDARSWIAVPVPDAAKIRASFKAFYVHAQLSELMNGVYSAESCHRVQFVFLSARMPCMMLVSYLPQPLAHHIEFLNLSRPFGTICI